MHVLICGGGVIGAATAYFLSCRGVRATVIERTGLACAASGKAGATTSGGSAGASGVPTAGEGDPLLNKAVITYTGLNHFHFNFGVIEPAFMFEGTTSSASLIFLERPEIGMHGRVPALLGGDRPRAAGVARRREEGIVAALPVRLPDRVDRRQVDDIEAQLGKPRERLLDPAEAAE